MSVALGEPGPHDAPSFLRLDRPGALRIRGGLRTGPAFSYREHGLRSAVLGSGFYHTIRVRLSLGHRNRRLAATLNWHCAVAVRASNAAPLVAYSAHLAAMVWDRNLCVQFMLGDLDRSDARALRCKLAGIAVADNDRGSGKWRRHRARPEPRRLSSVPGEYAIASHCVGYGPKYASRVRDWYRHRLILALPTCSSRPTISVVHPQYPGPRVITCESSRASNR